VLEWLERIQRMSRADLAGDILASSRLPALEILGDPLRTLPGRAMGGAAPSVAGAGEARAVATLPTPLPGEDVE